MIFKRYLFSVLIGLAVVHASGCATNVRPWERGYLAKEHMAIELNAVERTIREQVVTSKEASAGGHGVVGGGCGCN